ncbi:MAG: 30S ribosomal protein S16 [Planctomycetes bacterium]|nr:30S ribosomal protein S16 [Planctomycetota bacterium]
MVKIRLTRTGRKHYHTFRIVAADTTSPRDGRFIENLGHYNPNLKNTEEGHLVIHKDRIEHWLGKGAQPSDTVWNLLRKQGINKATARTLRQKLSAASA